MILKQRITNWRFILSYTNFRKSREVGLTIFNHGKNWFFWKYIFFYLMFQNSCFTIFIRRTFLNFHIVFSTLNHVHLRNFLKSFTKFINFWKFPKNNLKFSEFFGTLRKLLKVLIPQIFLLPSTGSVLTSNHSINFIKCFWEKISWIPFGLLNIFF